MLYRTTDLARWGAGKGSNLEPVEIDLNFWELAERLAAVEAGDGAAVNGIANIGVVGSQMTVYLEDGTALGPYTLPTAMIRYRGDWTAATAYNEMDLVTVPEARVYLVLADHTSGAEFDALAADGEGNSLYRWLFPMGGGGGGGASSLGELTDVVADWPPETGNVLVYEEGYGWYWDRPTLKLSELSDANSWNPVAGQVLTWDGSTWVNADAPLRAGHRWRLVFREAIPAGK
jgi:hypothetical protein